MFRFPILDVRQHQKLPLEDQNIQVQPQNTELSSEFPKPSENDIVFDGQDNGLWQEIRMVQKPDNPNIWIPKDNAMFNLIFPLMFVRQMFRIFLCNWQKQKISHRDTLLSIYLAVADSTLSICLS